MFKKWFLGIRMAIPMLLLSLIAVTPAFAQTGGTVVAGGLNNPRGVAVGDDLFEFAPVRALRPVE